MTLWTKPLNAVTYSDVVDFCSNKLPEGINVDYKADVPRDLEKIIASFANTSGGLVVIGATTDSQNRPDAIIGVANERGFTERIAQICRDRLQPPILPEMSSLIPLDGDASRAVAVLRVAQSPEAPHAVINTDRIYMRRNDVSDVIKLADLDRIEYLLERRRGLRNVNDENIGLNLERMKRFINFGIEPVVWWQVAPLYPWQPLCARDDCVRALLGIELRRAPNGAIGVGQIERRPDREGPVTFVSADLRGMFFRGQMFWTKSGEQTALHYGDIVFRTHDFLRLVQNFYTERVTTFPGMINLTIGFENVAGARMSGDFGPAGKFPDPSYRINQLMSYQNFIESDFAPQFVSGMPIMGEILHAFGLPA